MCRVLPRWFVLAGWVGSASLALAAEPEHPWPQWRGPSRDGTVQGPAWPDQLGPQHLVEQWRVPLGPGYSGPIVGHDSVFVTETVDQQTEVVRALDRASGREQWRASWPGALQVPFFARANGDWIRATPALDGQTLYVAGMRDVLVALDAGSGAERWRVDFVARYAAPLPAFGFVCSPLVDGDDVYVQAGAGVVQLDKHSGASRWRTLADSGGMWGSAFSSPVLTTLAGRRQLLVQTREKLAGVDPASGDLLWSVAVPAFRGMNILTPSVSAGGVLTSSYGGQTTLFRVTESDGSWQAEPAWTEKSQGYMSTPVIVGRHAYLHLRNQRLTCLDLEQGQSAWTTTPFGQYWSLVAQRDRILALDQRGELLLVKADPAKFELLDRRQLSQSPTWAHLAVAGDQLVVRTLDAVIVYRWRDPPAP
jgi:outer membrane protein assembly factor BamB